MSAIANQVGTSTRSLLEQCIPGDHSRQVDAQYYLRQLFDKPHQIRSVMDLGCGAGNSIEVFRTLAGNLNWVGLDIEDSPEVNQRRRQDAEFQTFDGTHIPYPGNSFDLIYCRQVFEHVRYPLELLKEVHRVLRPEGYFVGSTSHLEPYHSYSYWNFTPFGFVELLGEAGLAPMEIRPGIDGLSLILRRALGCPRFLDFLFKTETPFNFGIEVMSRVIRRNRKWSNAAKLLFCGHFCFLAGKK